MSTRKAPAASDRVRALNLVEIEFYGLNEVISAFKNLMININTSPPLPPDWHITQQKLITRLLTEMAKTLGYKLEQLDVLDGGYYPQVHAESDIDQQTLRRALIDVCSGRRALWVNQATPTPPNIYPSPPPPSQEDGTMPT